MSQWKSVNFSLDLKSAATLQRQFLREVNRYPALYGGPLLLQAINRYERFWLPLAAKYPREQLAAPLDIEWVWHCHMLAPLKYQKDSHTIAGCIVDHKLMNAYDRKSSLAKSQHYWRQMYPSEPFEVDLHGSLVDPKLQGPLVSSYDLVDAVSRQKVFLYQISLPHYFDQKYLDICQDRYKKFIYLKQMNPGKFIVPCYDIDLIWHTHQLYPLLYKKDSEALLGRTFNHDDTVTDRSVGSKLYNSDMETRELWQSTFREGFAVYGAMYRGNPPDGKLHNMDRAEIFAAATKSAVLKLESVKLLGLPSSVKKFKLKISAAADNKEMQTLASLKSPNQEWKDKNLVNYKFETKSTNCLKFRLEERTGFACFGSQMTLGESKYLMLSHIETGGTTATPLNVNIDLGNNQLKVNFKGSLSPPVQGPCLLFLSSGRYDNCIMPENVETMWGPVPLPPVKPGEENRCEVATHQLVNHTQQLVFTVRVIHSLPLLTSAIHVFYHDKMAAVAHLVGSDQLPLPTQVKHPDKCITLNPRAGERAILIKNSGGDWGIVKGRWGGYRKGVAGVKGTRSQRGKRGVPGCPGYLTFKFYDLLHGSAKELQLTEYLHQKFSFKFGSLFMDLKNGYVRVEEDTNLIPEHIALAFSISLLHVLCQPRPSDWKPGEPVQKQVSRGTQSVQYIPSNDMAFIMAAGFITMTPSNHYIYHTYGANACAGCGGGGMGDIAGVDTGVVDTDVGGGMDGGDVGCGDVGDTGGCGGG